MCTKANKQVFIIFQIILAILFILMFFPELSGDMSGNWELKCAIFTIALLIINIYFWARIGKGIFSFYTLFSAFIVLFHLSQQIIVGFNLMNDEQKIVVKRQLFLFGNNDAFTASMYCMIYLYFLMQGGLIYAYTHTKLEDTNIAEGIQEKIIACKMTGWIILLISIVPMIYCDSIIIKAAVTEGYKATFVAEDLFTGNPIDLIGSLFKPAIILLLSSYKNKKSTFDKILLLTVSYLLVRMFLTGDRGEDIIFIVVLVFIRHMLVKPIRGKKLIFILVSMYFVAFFLDFIQNFRLAPRGDINSIYLSLEHSLKSNIILKTMFDYGAIIWVFLLMFKSVPATGSFVYGKTYFYALFGQVFSILGISSYFMKAADFSYFLRDPARGAMINRLTESMGGSAIAEWYYNFGWVGLPLVILVGYLIGKLSISIYNNKNNSFVFGILCIIMNISIWLVRQYFYNLIWHSLVYISFSFFIYLFCISYVRNTKYLKGVKSSV